MNEGVWCWDEHDWYDATRLGDPNPRLLCVNCNAIAIQPETWRLTSDGYIERERLPGQLRGVHGLSYAA